MLTDRKEREDYMMLLREQEADTDAHRQEGRENYMILLTEQEAYTEAEKQERQIILHDDFYITGG